MDETPDSCGLAAVETVAVGPGCACAGRCGCLALPICPLALSAGGFINWLFVFLHSGIAANSIPGNWGKQEGGCEFFNFIIYQLMVPLLHPYSACLAVSSCRGCCSGGNN